MSTMVSIPFRRFHDRTFADNRAVIDGDRRPETSNALGIDSSVLHNSAFSAFPQRNREGTAAPGQPQSLVRAGRLPKISSVSAAQRAGRAQKKTKANEVSEEDDDLYEPVPARKIARKKTR